MRLTKTNLMAGLQCPKHLHLMIRHKEHASKTKTPASITGEVVEEHAEREFSDGITVKRFGGDDPFEQTQHLLDDSSVETIFQAAFTANDVEVFVDVLQRVGDQWDLIEIKAATSVKDHFIDDVSIQAKTAEQAGLAINRIKLMHVNNQFVYQGDHDYDGLFIQEDITDKVKARWSVVPKNVEDFKQVLAGPEPEVHITGHCKQPYLCEFRQYCETVDTKYPVGLLPRGHRIVPTLLANGITDIRDIPFDMLNSDNHIRVRNVTIEGKAELLPEAGEILKQLDYPRYYLDFESIQFAIPIWEGTQPYQQLPFQWSCHIENENGDLEHEEFLDVSGNDPRQDFAEALVKTCKEDGPIIVYNQAFEKMVIRSLAEEFSDLSSQLLALNERIFDLLPIVQTYYYHPDMRGSWSIKKVLPCLAPDLKYSDLGDVQDGTQAQQSYLDIIRDMRSTDGKAKLTQDLLNYCKLDTLAMVEISKSLVKQSMTED
jgi:hypothetical protein